eukprot:1287010-Rhodomonas_salina.3
MACRANRNSDAEPVQAMFAPTEQTSVYPPPTREQETCPHGQKYSSGQDFAQAPALAHRTKRVALVITGQVFRFTFNTTAMHVVRPNIEAGHSVHVFVYLSRDDCRGSHNSNVWAHAHMSDPLSDDGEQQLADAFKTEVCSSSFVAASFAASASDKTVLAGRKARRDARSLRSGKPLEHLGGHWGVSLFAMGKPPPPPPLRARCDVQA